MRTKVIVQAGQYEQAAETVTIRHFTQRGWLRRCRQLARQHAVYGDNRAGWLRARVAIASPGQDVWTRNQIIGGSSCEPLNGWLDLD